MLVKTAETKKPHGEGASGEGEAAAEANNHQNRVVNFPSERRRRGEGIREVVVKVPFQVPFLVAKIVIHMQGLH